MALTVKELRERLEGYSDDTPVHISYNYGDHWRTRVAPAASEVDELEVVHSAYHDMDALVDEDRDDENTDNDKERKMVVVIY